MPEEIQRIETPFETFIKTREDDGTITVKRVAKTAAAVQAGTAPDTGAPVPEPEPKLSVRGLGPVFPPLTDEILQRLQSTNEKGESDVLERSASDVFAAAGGAVAGGIPGAALSLGMNQLSPLRKEEMGGDFGTAVGDYGTARILADPRVAFKMAQLHPGLRVPITAGMFAISALGGFAAGARLQEELLGEDIPIMTQAIQRAGITGLFALPIEGAKAFLSPRGFYPSVAASRIRSGEIDLSAPGVVRNPGSVDVAVARMQRVFKQAGLPDMAKFSPGETIGSPTIKHLGKWGVEAGSEESERLAGMIEVLFDSELADDDWFRIARELDIVGEIKSKGPSNIKGKFLTEALEDQVQFDYLTRGEANLEKSRAIISKVRDAGVDAISGGKFGKLNDFADFMESAQQELNPEDYKMLSDDMVKHLILYPAAVKHSGLNVRKGMHKYGEDVPSFLDGGTFADYVDTLNRDGVVDRIWGKGKGQILKDMAQIVRFTDPNDLIAKKSIVADTADSSMSFIGHRVAFWTFFGGQGAVAGSVGGMATGGLMMGGALGLASALQMAFRSNGRASRAWLEALQRGDQFGARQAMRQLINGDETQEPVGVPDEAFLIQ